MKDSYRNQEDVVVKDANTSELMHDNSMFGNMNQNQSRTMNSIQHETNTPPLRPVNIDFDKKQMSFDEYDTIRGLDIRGDEGQKTVRVLDQPDQGQTVEPLDLKPKAESLGIV